MLQPVKTINAVKTIWINARFLARPITGVERVAREIIHNLATEHLDDYGFWSDASGCYQFKLVAPISMKMQSPWPNLPLHRAGLLSGHAWEQLDLPCITFGDCLVSLCNSGPLFKRNHLVFLHDAQPFAIPHNFSLRFRMWYRIIFSVLARCARRVLVNSEFTRSELSRFISLNPDKTDLCYLGCDHVNRIPVTADTLRRFELPDTDYVLAVSSENPNKNFKAVVASLAMLGADAPACVIVGQQSQGHFSNASIEQGKVIHLGYVSDEELCALYQRALCLVFPSFYEGFGLPPLEAMMAGCPVIVSRTSALQEIGADAALYCQPDDPCTLAEKIMLLSSSPSQRREYAQKSRTHAKEFTWDSSGNVVLRAIMKCNRQTTTPEQNSTTHAVP